MELAQLIADRIRNRVWELQDAFPYDAPNCYWLESDCGESYCREHAIEARAKEFGFGPLLRDPDWYRRNELDEAFFDGISAGRDGESDHCETCSTCGKTLSYVLTDYGAESELDHFLSWDVTPDALTGSIIYELERVTLNVWRGTARPQLLDTAIVVSRVWRAWKSSENRRIEP